MRTQTEGDILRVLDLDRLSGTNSNHFKELVKVRLTDQHRVLELDFGRVSFMDSEGLGALVSAHKAMCERQGRLRLLKPQAAVRQLLETVNFHKLFELVP